ncbi:MAG: Mur ligase family protein, partial [Gammaproteobacteria bacterium]|nr:Mur ligase family protein [Gammaproteobacteria bacterium]
MNITPDHMDRYDHFADYCATKHRVFQHASIAVTNGDDDLTACKNSQVKTQFSFTLRPPQQHQFGITYKNNQAFLAYEQTLLIPVSDMPLKGRHAHANALAALAIGYAAGFPLTGMCEVLKTFTGLPHRCQLVRTRAGVRWFNDSKGTNVGATIAAIQGLGGDMDGRLILIAGGVGKQADFSPLSPVISQYVREVVLIGEAAQDIA